MKLIYDDDSSKTKPLEIDGGKELKRKKLFDDVSNQLTVIEVIKSLGNFLIKLPVAKWHSFLQKEKSS